MRHLHTRTLFGEEYLFNMQKRLDGIYSTPGTRESTLTLDLPSGIVVLPGFIDHQTQIPALDPPILVSTKPNKENRFKSLNTTDTAFSSLQMMPR